MPTYEYQCHKCLKTFEVFQSMKDPRLTICPEALCQNEEGWGRGEVTRLLGTGAGIIFKGSGFYSTDYRSQNYQEGAKKDAPPAAGGSEAGKDKSSAAPAPATPSGGGGGGEKSGSSSTPTPPPAPSAPKPAS